MGPENWTETSRRVRAAMAYAGIKREEAATVMDTKPGTLDRIIGTKGKETKTATWPQLQRLAHRAGLPAEWFSADLHRLAEIVSHGPVFVNGPSLAETADEVARRLDDTQPRPEQPPRAADDEDPEA